MATKRMQSAAPQHVASAQNGTGTPAQGDAEWDQFQAFVAEVEKKEEDAETEVNSHTKKDESKERDAEESLENMEYVDRYRKILEQQSGASVDKPTSSSSATESKKRAAEEQGEQGEKEEEDLPSIVRLAAAESAKRRRLLLATEISHHTGSGTNDSDGSDSDDDSLDLNDWRSKRI